MKRDSMAMEPREEWNSAERNGSDIAGKAFGKIVLTFCWGKRYSAYP